MRGERRSGENWRGARPVAGGGAGAVAGSAVSPTGRRRHHEVPLQHHRHPSGAGRAPAQVLLPSAGPCPQRLIPLSGPGPVLSPPLQGLWCCLSGPGASSATGHRVPHASPATAGPLPPPGSLRAARSAVSPQCARGRCCGLSAALAL